MNTNANTKKSACVCAAGRVYSTATLDYLGDTTYGVSKTALWSLAETTCVLVVFCMPALPKAFSRVDMDNVLDKLASLRSWSRLKSLGSRRTSQDKSGGYDWPARTTGSEENDELKAYPIGQGDRYTVEALTLAEVKLVQEQRAKLGTSTGTDSIEGNAILRTTEIGQEASYNTNEEFDPYLIVTHERQHPWVGGECWIDLSGYIWVESNSVGGLQAVLCQ